MKKYLWRMANLLTAFVFALALPVIIKEIALKPLRFNLFDDHWSGQMFQWTISLLLIFTGYYLHEKYLWKRTVSELSWRKAIKENLLGAMGGVASILIILLILGGIGTFKIQGFSLEKGSYQMVVLLFLLATTEEILFRGIIYSKIERWWGIPAALSISSLLFSALHFNNDHFNIISFLAVISGGAFVGLLYSVTKSLWWPIGFHFAWNLTQVLMGIRLSGSDEFSELALFQSDFYGHKLLTGGDFGVENSLIAISFTTVAAIVMFIIIRSRKEVAVSRP